jgi:O-antigen/teichoic acid export membrane protein
MALAASELALQNTDLLVISSYLTPADVGIYFAAAKTMSLILFVHFAVGSAVAQRFSALKARGDDAELLAFVKDAVNWTFWPSLAAALIILVLGLPLLSLFGSEFTSGYPVMFILVVGFLLRSAVGPVELLLNMLGQQAACATVLAVTAILNLALNLMFVPAFGLVGAALSTATSLAVAAVANAIVARRTLGIDTVIWHNLPFAAKA